MVRFVFGFVLFLNKARADRRGFALFSKPAERSLESGVERMILDGARLSLAAAQTAGLKASGSKGCYQRISEKCGLIVIRTHFPNRALRPECAAFRHLKWRIKHNPIRHGSYFNLCHSRWLCTFKYVCH